MAEAQRIMINNALNPQASAGSQAEHLLGVWLLLRIDDDGRGLRLRVGHGRLGPLLGQPLGKGGTLWAAVDEARLRGAAHILSTVLPVQRQYIPLHQMHSSRSAG